MYYDPSHYACPSNGAHYSNKLNSSAKQDSAYSYETTKYFSSSNNNIVISGRKMQGLRNIGNSCFIAAILQSLRYTRWFTNFLDEQHSIPCMEKNTLLYSTRRLYQALENPQYTSQSLFKLFQAFRSHLPSDYRGLMQQDSQEFLLYLFEQLNECLIANSRLMLEVPALGADSVNDKSTRKQGSLLQRILPQSQQKNSVKAPVPITILPKPQTANAKEHNNNDHHPALKHWRSSVQEYSSLKDAFMGQLESVLECDVCKSRSVTYEEFWNLSLPISINEHHRSKDKTHRLPSPQKKHSYLELSESGTQQRLEQLAYHHRTQSSTSLPDQQSSTRPRSSFDETNNAQQQQLEKPTTSLEECLTAFTHVEKLSDTEMPFCEKCNKLTSATKQYKISRLPDVLVLQLKRFIGHNHRKIVSMVTYPEELDLQPYVASQAYKSFEDLPDFQHLFARPQTLTTKPVPINGKSTKKGSSKNENKAAPKSPQPAFPKSPKPSKPCSGTSYNLRSIVGHSGNLTRGHYFAYSRVISSDENACPEQAPWCMFDDEIVVLLDKKGLVTKHAYILIYERNIEGIEETASNGHLTHIAASAGAQTPTNRLATPSYELISQV